MHYIILNSYSNVSSASRDEMFYSDNSDDVRSRIMYIMLYKFMFSFNPAENDQIG